MPCAPMIPWSYLIRFPSLQTVRYVVPPHPSREWGPGCARLRLWRRLCIYDQPRHVKQRTTSLQQPRRCWALWSGCKRKSDCPHVSHSVSWDAIGLDLDLTSPGRDVLAFDLDDTWLRCPAMRSPPMVVAIHQPTR